MINLKTLLNESNGYKVPRTTSLAQQKVKKFIETNCAVALKKFKNNIKFYRSDANGKLGAIHIINPTKTPRFSKDGTNLYALYMESSPYWKKYPRRSRSVIFAGSREAAERYSGKLYYIFPIGNPTVAVAQSADFWAARTVDGDVQDFMDQLKFLFKGTGLDVYRETDPKKFVKLLPKVLTLYSIEEKLAHSIHDFLNPEKNSWQEVIKQFYKILTPKTARTDLCKLSGFTQYHNDIDGSECWTEGKCLAIQESIFKILFPEFNEINSEETDFDADDGF